MSDRQKVMDVLIEGIAWSRPEIDNVLQMLIRHTPPETAATWIRNWSTLPGRVRGAVAATGMLGDPALVGWLIDCMNAPLLARLAGEAFTIITGRTLDERPFEGEWPDGFEAGPNDDPDDENVEMDPDENLPWPNRAAAADWWMRHRDEFTPGVRYLLGRPLDEESWLEQVLRESYQRQRAAAALELAIRRPTEPLFNVAAPAWRQKSLLGLK